MSLQSLVKRPYLRRESCYPKILAVVTSSESQFAASSIHKFCIKANEIFAFENVFIKACACLVLARHFVNCCKCQSRDEEQCGVNVNHCQSKIPSRMYINIVFFPGSPIVHLVINKRFWIDNIFTWQWGHDDFETLCIITLKICEVIFFKMYTT